MVEEEASRKVVGMFAISILTMNYPIEEVGVDMDKKEEYNFGEDKVVEWKYVRVKC